MDKSAKPILAAASCTIASAEDSGCGGDDDDSSTAAVDMVERLGGLQLLMKERDGFVWICFCESNRGLATGGTM
jgi:hypothetical protein